MVFEHLTAFFIDKFLGNYIEDFDSTQLKISLWDGNITLENVHLKTNALNDFNVPLEIITGYLEKLKIHIPWKHLYTQPTKIEIDGFYLLVAPKTDVNYDPERKEKEEYESKMKEVTKVEKFRQERELYEKNKLSPHHKDTFFERLQFHILRNLEISIKNIHIAYEDKTTKSYPFQFGINLHSIKLHTTNSEWEDVLSKDDSPIIYKLAEINSLSVYWNSNIKSRLDLSKEDIIDNLKTDNHVRFSKMNYILQPLNVKAKLKIAKTAQEQDFEQAVLDAKIEFEEIYININRNQYSDLLDLLEFEDYLSMKSKYIKYHHILNDNQSEKINIRRWKFAYTAIVNEYVRPRLAAFKWENIKENLDRYKVYHKLYFQQLNHQNNKQDKLRVQELEKQIDVFNLIYIRRTSQIEYIKKKIEDKEMSWWDKLTGWWSADSHEDNPEFQLNDSLAIEEKNKLYQAIGYQDNQSSKSLSYPEEYIDIDLSIRLNLIEINVWSLVNENDSHFKVIARASTPNTDLQFQRRPARDDFLVIVDLDSFEMFGIDSECKKEDELNLSRPVLIQPFHQAEFKENKLFHIEFESNPINTNCDYRILGKSQCLQINYHAMTINKLIQCFLPDRHHDLEGIKEAAYSIYTDIKHRTQFLLNENLKKIKDLDINIDLQSIYFLIPENGYFTESSPVICLDFGHFLFQAGDKNVQNQEEDIYHDAQSNVDDGNDSSYVPMKILLENVQLLYLNQSEDWKDLRFKEDSPSHFISPITLTLDILKSIQTDNPKLPIWKTNGEICAIESRISDTRLFGFIKLIQSIPFPQSSETDQKEIEKVSSKNEKQRSSTKQTYETIENMTPVKKVLYEQDQEEQKQLEVGSEEQITQLKANFNISKIDLLFERALLDLSDYTEPFLRISLVSIVASTIMKTYDMEFNASLTDFVIIHEQFETKDENRLHLLSRETNSPFFRVNCLLTSTENPSFSSSPYNSIENNIHLELTKSILNIQLEALTSIIQYKNNLQEKLSNLPKEKIEQKQSKSTPSKTEDKPVSFKIDFRLEKISLYIGNQYSQILYIKLKDFNGYLSKTNFQTSSHFILHDFSIIDLYSKSPYQFIISKQNKSNDLIIFDLSLFIYSKKPLKIPKDQHSFIKGHFEKTNIVFLYKHLDLILSIINSLQAKQNNAEQRDNDVTSDEPTFLSATLQKHQEQSLEFQLNFILNAPQILIPVNSYSSHAVLLDLGRLTMHTDSKDQVIPSSSEQHRITFENLSANRVILNNKNEVLSNVILLECSPFVTLINRRLNSENDDDIYAKVQWDSIEFKYGKDDYTFINKIFAENFKEKFFFKTSQTQNTEQQIEYEQNESSDNLPTKQSASNKISPKIRLDFQIKQIGLTLYLNETNLNKQQISRDENSKFIYLTIQMIEANFRQLADCTYSAKAQIQHLLLDDLRRDNNISRLINKNFNVDQNSPLLTVTAQLKQNDKTSIRTVNGQMESFYVLISPDFVNSMKEFITYNVPSDEETKSNRPIRSSSISDALQSNIPPPAKSISQYRPLKREKSSSKAITNDQRPPKRSVPSDVETNVEMVVKPCQVILIEDQNNNDSNCLVLNFAFSMRLMNNGDDTKISSSIKDLAFYGSSFEQLKDSKVKYSVLQPSHIDAVVMINSSEQKIDLYIGDLSINIDPALIKTFVTLSTSINKEQTEGEPKEEKDKINSKSIFDPKPFKDSSFWFIQDSEVKDELIEETDLLEITTGTPSQKTNELKQKTKEKNIEKYKNLYQQLIINLKIFEIKLELGVGSSVRPVVAICLSDIFADIQNWSSDIIVSSTIQVELALFNDHLLAWEPLIEPIIDERGIVQSPWSITCETIEDKQDENDDECRFLLDDDKSSSTTEKSEKKEGGGMKLDVKKVIYIRAEHLLNVTLTKTTLDLGQRLSVMFNDAYKKGSISDDDEEQAILSVLNQTGYDITIDKITGVQLPKENKSEGKSFKLKMHELLHLTIPAERLSATHLPTISEQVANRKQGFEVQIDDRTLSVDINQTWRRVYELSASPIANWPIQLLCDSQIYQERRRVILSSIIKVSNRTQMPLIVLDADSIETRKFNRIAQIDVNQEYYLPIQILYSRVTPRLYFAIEQDGSNGEINDFISFDWANESTSDRVLKLNDGKEAHYVVYKEEIEAYSENTDEPVRKSFNIYVKLALHLINLLPIPIQCSIDNIENVDLKPSELYHSTQGNKKSILIFTIPSYNNASWISEAIDLSVKGYGIHNEHIVKFHDRVTQEILRMVLRVDTYRQSYRASFYSPFWIINANDLKFEMKIENDKIFIDVVDQPFFICPKKFHSDSHKKKGHIRLYSQEQDENVSEWSEGFSLDVIKSTGMTACKVLNDRTYMVCIDIVTCSFGMTKIVTLTPSTAIINNSSIDVEIAENISAADEENWKLVKANQIIPYWPRNIKDGVMYVRYHGETLSSSCFSIKDKHRTLLRMNDEQRPAIHVEVTATDFDGYKVIFGDYKIGDAPLLIVNALLDKTISFCQKDDVRTQVLPEQFYVYYTWTDPFKPRELIVASNGNSATIQLNPACGVLDKESEDRIYYAIFHDGPQTVLIFSHETSIIESVSDMPSTSELMNDYIQIGLCSVGISIINDITRDDLFYISINQSKEIWTEKRKFNIRPVSQNLNQHLEEHYKSYIKQSEENSNDQQREKKYEIDKNRHVSFDDNVAQICDHEDHVVHVKRQSLDGLWIGYAWSTSNMAVHLRINHIQIDNQLQVSMFPTILYPIVSKATGTDIPGKAFIELSVFKSQSLRSNTIQIKYFKLLIQEFAFCADQGLILAIIAFAQAEKNPAAPAVDMDADLKRISNPLETIVKGETDNTSGETKIYFDDLHLSPLKIHVSFSIHGSKPSEQLLAEYPLADFLLQILNVAEVQDVILKLNYYERKNDRYSITKLTKEIGDHYTNQFLKQLHVVVLGLDVLGNPFGVVRGVAEGVESFFYEPYKGAMEGPIEFLEGIATGTKYLVGSVVGGTAGALSKVTGAASKGLATLTLDKDYQNARIQRKELQAETTPEIVSSGKNTLKDIMLGVKGVVKKPVAGAKQGGGRGFIKGLGKGFLGLVGRPASGIADLTSTSLKLIKRVATHEEIVHRVRQARHVGRDGIVRPSIAHETLGNYIFDEFNDDKHNQTEGYIAHIKCSSDPLCLLFVTTKRVLFLTENSSAKGTYQIEWDYHYKELKGSPTVKFDPDFIEITLKETNALGMTKKDRLHVKVAPYANVGEARYLVDKIIETMTALEV